MTHHNPFLLELFATDRHAQLLRDAERRRTSAAARPPGARASGAGRLIRACLYRTGALLVTCGSALVRWAEGSGTRAQPAARRLLPSC